MESSCLVGVFGLGVGIGRWRWLGGNIGDWRPPKCQAYTYVGLRQSNKMGNCLIEHWYWVRSELQLLHGPICVCSDVHECSTFCGVQLTASLYWMGRHVNVTCLHIIRAWMVGTLIPWGLNLNYSASFSKTIFCNLTCPYNDLRQLGALFSRIFNSIVVGRITSGRRWILRLMEVFVLIYSVRHSRGVPNKERSSRFKPNAMNTVLSFTAKCTNSDVGLISVLGA